MKAISLLQPWASLVVLGAKEYETRSWKTKHRGKLLIHASARMMREHIVLCRQPLFPLFVPEPEKLPLGAIVGMVELVSVHHTEDVLQHISGQEIAFGDYGPGRYAWKLENPVLFETPIPCAGALSIWDSVEPVARAGTASVDLFIKAFGRL